MASGTPIGRSGYVAAIIVNIALFFVVENLLGWNLLPFLTTDFNRIIGLIELSLIVTIVVNLIYLAYDAPRFKALGRIVISVISLAIAIRMWRVFPFDFSTMGFDWTWIVRAIIALAITGAAVAILADLVKLARGTT
jgi:hypothetical protein